MAITFDERPIYLGDRILLTGSYEAADTDPDTATNITVPGITIDAVLNLGFTPTPINIGTCGNLTLPTQVVIGVNYDSFSLSGIETEPGGGNNGGGKLLIIGRRT